MKNTILCIGAIVFCNAVFSGCGREPVPQDQHNVAMERAQMVQIARDAYVYGFPMVLTEITKRHMTNPLPGTGNVSVNQIRHYRSFADENFNAFVIPNSDMFYSFAWLDLSKEPMLLEIPETANRYCLFTFFDAWTDIFASIGSRTTGASAQKIAVTGPSWSGVIPEGFSQYRSGSNIVFIEGIIQVKNKQDAETAVKRIQDGIKLYPLSAHGGKYSPPKARPDDTLPAQSPLEQVLSMNISEFFNIFNQSMMKNPPRQEDAEILDKILDLGVAPGMRFDITIFDFDTQEAIKDVRNWFGQYASNMKTENPDKGWSYIAGTGNYQTDYALRAKTAYHNFGANFDEDITVMSSYADADNEKYVLSKKYVLHFEKGEMPPVNAAWSVSAYNGSGFFEKNTQRRYSAGSKDNLKFNKDGSLDIYIQQADPGKDRQNNWLPVSAEEFFVVLRGYFPKEDLAGGGWEAPQIKKSK